MVNNFALDTLKDQLAVLETELESVRSRSKEIQNQIKDLEAGISAITGQPVPEKKPRARGFSVKHRIIDLLEGSENGMTPQEIAEKFSEAGRETSIATIASTLSRLKKEHAVKKINDLWHSAKGPNVRSDQGGLDRTEAEMGGATNTVPFPSSNPLPQAPGLHGWKGG